MTTTSAVLSTILGINGKSREEEVLRLLVELGAQVVGATEGSILVLDEKKKALVFALTIGSRESERTLIGQRVPLGRGITGLAAVTREVQVGHPTYKDIRQRVRAAGGKGHPSAVLAAPMLIQDSLVGVLTAVSFDPKKRFGSGDMTLYGRIASVAGVVVEQNRRLKTIEALQQSRRDTTPIPGEKRIVETLGRLAKAAPRRQERIADLLDAVGALVKS